MVSTLTWVLATGTAITLPIAIIAGGFAPRAGGAHRHRVRGHRRRRLPRRVRVTGSRPARRQHLPGHPASFAPGCGGRGHRYRAVCGTDHRSHGRGPCPRRRRQHDGGDRTRLSCRAGCGRTGGGTSRGAVSSCVRRRAAQRRRLGLLCALAFGTVHHPLRGDSSISPLAAVAVSRAPARTDPAARDPLRRARSPWPSRYGATLGCSGGECGSCSSSLRWPSDRSRWPRCLWPSSPPLPCSSASSSTASVPSRVQLVGVLCTILAVTALALA